jgi:hypothetical protein
MNQQRFRTLICWYAALVIAEALAASLAGGYSQALSDAMDKEETPLILENGWLLLGVLMPFAAAAFAGLYGLYMFKQWGRTVSLYTTAVGLLLVLLLGPSLYSALEGVFLEASTMLWGAILALSFYSPVSTLFSADNALRATGDGASV